MTWVVTPESVVSTAQQSVIETFLLKVFNAVIDFLYTIVDVLVTFFTQQTVLWALVVIALIYWAYRMLKRKSVSL